MPDDDQSQKDAFLEARQEKDANLVTELIEFMSENKKWWLSPIIVVLLLLGALVILGPTGFAPFIYSLF